jgi:hypothetical protein
MEAPEDPRPTHPPGFEPPTDENVPWYAWVIWPLALLLGIGLAAAFIRGCFTAMS